MLLVLSYKALLYAVLTWKLRLVSTNLFLSVLHMIIYFSSNVEPPPLETFCSVAVWSNPQLPCDDIMGYEVQLYDPDSGHEVSYSVASYSTYYTITDEDKFQIELNKAYIQVT